LCHLVRKFVLQRTEGTKTHYYNYDGIGRLVSFTTYENGIVTDYQAIGYDEFSRNSFVTEKFGCNEVKDSYTYNETNGLVTSVTQQYHAGYKNSTNTFSYSYDHLKRADSTTVAHDGKSYSVSYRYANNLKDSAYTSNLINRKSYGTSVYESDAYKFDYVYDRVGNIKTATVTSKYDSDYVYTVRYGYDEQNQLVSERCAATNRAYVYEYDTYGNIRSKKTYTYGNYASPSDIAANCTLLSTDVYEYDDYEWFDLLTEYNNVPFSHDIIGNPLTYYNGKNYTFTWQNGRQMASASVNGLNIGFEYDIDGLRTKKTVQNGETYNYYYSGSKLHAMTWENGAKMLSFLYDSSGAPYSMVYCYTESGVKYSSSYYYVTNLQGDVVALMNANHVIVAEYLYDAWGNILSITDVNGTDISGNATHIANLNPLRYRGYVYDNETGFYYLQSRYYDPAVGRFVNGDAYASTGTGFLGHNMFAYCNNNPVMFIDPSGKLLGGLIVIGAAVVGVTLVLTGCSSKQSDNSSKSSKSSKSTKSKKSSTPSPSVSSTPSQHSPTQQEKSYAATVYAEAGGENKITKQAVAHVMNNRIGTRSSWTDIEAVISAKSQFDGYNSTMYQAAMDYYNNGVCNNSIDQAAMDECLDVVIPIYYGEETDITGGALYFHSFANPSDWAYHEFYTQVYIPGTESFWFYK